MRTGLADTIRVESHGPVQFKTRSQAALVYSVPAGQRPERIADLVYVLQRWQSCLTIAS
jgi:hypothetical protein